MRSGWRDAPRETGKADLDNVGEVAHGAIDDETRDPAFPCGFGHQPAPDCRAGETAGTGHQNITRFNQIDRGMNGAVVADLAADGARLPNNMHAWRQRADSRIHRLRAVQAVGYRRGLGITPGFKFLRRQPPEAGAVLKYRHGSAVSETGAGLAILVAWRGKDIENPAAILAGAHRVRHAAGRAPEIAFRERDLLTALITDAGAFEAQAPLLFGVVMHASLGPRRDGDDRNHCLVTGVDMRRQPLGKLPDDGVAAVIDIVKLGMLKHRLRVPLAVGQVGRAEGLTVLASLSYCRGSRQGDAASGMISTRRPACRPCALPQTPRALLWWTPRSAVPDSPAACSSSG